MSKIPEFIHIIFTVTEMKADDVVTAEVTETQAVKPLFFRRAWRRAKRVARKVKKTVKKVAKKTVKKVKKVGKKAIKKVKKVGKTAVKIAKNPVKFVKNTYKNIKSKINQAKILVKMLADLKKSYSKVKHNGKTVQCWKMYGNYCGGGYCGNKWWDSCRGNKVDGEKCTRGPFFNSRPKPIDEVDACCMKHDDCCSNVRLDSLAGKKVPCNCNKQMGECFKKAKKTCKNDKCKVAGNLMEKLSLPFKVVKCDKSCFNLKFPFEKTFKKIGGDMLKGLKKGLGGVKIAFGSIKSIFKKKRSSSKKAVKKAKKTVKRAFNKVKNGVKKTTKKVKTGLKKRSRKFGKVLKKAAGGVGKAFRKVGGTLKNGFSSFKNLFRKIKLGKGKLRKGRKSKLIARFRNIKPKRRSGRKTKRSTRRRTRRRSGRKGRKSRKFGRRGVKRVFRKKQSCNGNIYDKSRVSRGQKPDKFDRHHIIA
eukprot:gene3176-5492_t